MNLLCALATLCPLPAVSPSSDELTLAVLEKLRDEIMKDVEELRGLEFKKPVAVEIASKDELLAYAEERNDDAIGAEAQEADTTVARMLALIPADMDLEEAALELLQDQAAGFYDPATDTFYIVEGFDAGGMLRIILAHELTHALDDQYHDIDGVLFPRARENSDSAAAYMAVVEGSGTAVMNGWAMPRALKGEISMNDLKGADTTAGLGDAPEILWKSMLHSYLQGAAFLARTDNVMKGQVSPPDRDDLERAFREPPLSTEQILHPEKYWVGEQLDEPRKVTLTAKLSDGWELVREDTFGELALSMVTTPAAERKPFDPSPMAVATMRFGNDAAAGWGGDRFALFERGDARVLFLETVWDSEDEAVEFEEAMEERRTELEARARELGNGVGSMRLDIAGDRVTLVLAYGARDDGVVTRVVAAVEER